MLRRRGVDLLEIPVRATVGLPLRAGRVAAAWPAVRFDLASPLTRPDPPRLAVRDTAAPPPTVEALDAARDRYLRRMPARYRLQFEPALIVAVAGEHEPPTVADRWRRAARRATEAWRDLGDLASGRPPRLRLLLAMSAAEARRLYVALEPELSLLIAPIPPPAEASGSIRERTDR